MKSFQNPNVELIVPLPRNKTISKTDNCLKALSKQSMDKLIEMKKQKMLNPYAEIKFSNAKNILMNSIRDIKKTIYTNPPIRDKWKIYLIFDAEKLSYPKQEAGNALLKILEEPPKQTLFILISSDSNKILDTIHSRCIEFYFPPIDKDKYIKYCVQKNIKVDGFENIMYKLADGNLCQVTNEGNLNIEKIVQTAYGYIESLIENSMNNNWIIKLEEIFNKKTSEYELLIKTIVLLLYDLEKLTHSNTNILFEKSITLFKKNDNKLNYIESIDIIENSYNKLNQNVNPSLGLYAMTIELKKKLNGRYAK